MGIEEIEAEIRALEASLAKYAPTRWSEEEINVCHVKIQRAERKLAKEEAKLPVHPA